MGRSASCRGAKKRASFKCAPPARASGANQRALRPRTVVYKKSTSMVLVGIQLLMFLVLLNYYVDMADASSGLSQTRESRKMFGGYRITPRFCTPTRSASRHRSNEQRRGPAICMFNHECLQRNGEVVGACMDGFLFGACCQLKGEAAIIKDSVESGVVMMLNSSEGQSVRPSMKIPDSSIYMIKTTENPVSYQYSTPEQPSSKEDVVELGTHYIKHPSTLSVSINHFASSTEKFDDLTSSGVAQIANTLLQGDPTSDGSIVTMISSSNPSGLFSHSTISHEEADTILLNENGSVANDVFRPSDFSANVQVSTLQTKPSMNTRPLSTTPSSDEIVYRPIHQKPIFKPKPTKTPTNSQDKFVLVPTMTKPVKDEEPESHSEMGSIESIMNMLNESHPSTIAPDDLSTSLKTERPENRLTTVESYQSTTTTPLVQSTTYSSKYPTAGHYVTTSINKYTTFQPPSTSYVYSPIITRRPGYSGSTNKFQDKYGSTSVFYTKKPTVTKTTSKPNIDVSISDNLSSTTLSYDEYWGPNTNSYSSTPSNKNPPSTSYVYSPVPTKRPASNVHNVVGPSYDSSGGNLDTFSSVTPTVIVLSSLDSQHGDESFTSNPVKFPEKEAVEVDQSGQDEFVQVPLKPHKKPIHQVTINNIITSNNMIHLGQNQKEPSSSEKPAPTVLITPKPSTVTSASVSYVSKPQKPSVSVNDPNRPTKKPSANRRTTVKPTTAVPVVTPYTTIKNEYFTSSDDLINFPPVRNPNLNATGSNPNIYNSSVTLGIEDDIVLQEVEFTTPAFLQEDDDLNDKMSLFVNKIVGSLQGTFQELHDIVILDKTPNKTITQQNVKKPTTESSDSEIKPTKKPNSPTKRPSSTTSKKPTKATLATRRPTVTTKKPVRTATTPTTTTTTTIATTKKPVRATSPTTKKPRPTKAKTTTPVPTTITEVSVGEEDTFTTEVADGSYKHLCGVRPLVKSGRIVGGKGATFGEWPWQVLVRESTWLGLFTKNKCGGVLITNRYVTTAAHCQPGFLASLVAVFGEFDISGELESKRSVSKNVRRVIVHRQYDAATFENDLALLELESPIHYDSHIVPICMPSDDAEFTGRMATVTGWGRLKYGGGVPSVLQEVRVPIMENSVCQEMFQAAGHTKVILESFLCAGYANGQKDSCEGDSGGPLVLQRTDGRWELAGTVSHGIKCAAPYLPGVYMRTTYYKPWLRSITGVH